MDKGNKMDDQHIVTSFDEELKDLTDGHRLNLLILHQMKLLYVDHPFCYLYPYLPVT